MKREIINSISFLVSTIIDFVCFIMVGLNLLGFIDTDEKTLIIICFFGIYSSINTNYAILSKKLSGGE